MIGPFLFEAAAATTAAPLVTLKDWVAGCDNGRACMAVGQYNPANFDLASVVVERGAEADGAPKIWFAKGDGRPVDLAADGKRLNVTLAIDADDYIVTVAPRSVPAVIAAFTSAKVLTTVGADGKPGERLSSDGVSAALRWIDAQQKRAGTVTAMVATGPAPASAVPPPPPLPIVQHAVPSGPFAKPLTDAEIRAIQQEHAECTDEDDLQGKVDYGRIDARTTLAIVTAICGSGAYNYYGIPLLFRDDGRRSIADFDGAGEEGDTTMNLSWDDKRRVLSSSFKGRGIGDCGGGSDWVWDGAKFRAIKESLMSECQGAISWITVYRATPVAPDATR